MSPIARIIVVVIIVLVVLMVLGVIAKARDDSDSRDDRRGRQRHRRTKGGTWSGKRTRSPRDSKCRSCSRSPDARRTIHDSGISLSSSSSCDDRSPDRRSIHQGPHARIPRSRSCERSRSSSSSSSSSSSDSCSRE